MQTRNVLMHPEGK